MRTVSSGTMDFVTQRPFGLRLAPRSRRRSVIAILQRPGGGHALHVDFRKLELMTPAELPGQPCTIVAVLPARRRYLLHKPILSGSEWE
jgi:hypothetical protein